MLGKCLLKQQNICEPSVTVFLNICRILKVPDIMEAYIGENTGNPLSSLNEKGWGKAVEFISLLENFNNGEYNKDNDIAVQLAYVGNAKNDSIVRLKAYKHYIKIYNTRVSAGNGIFLDGDGYDTQNRKEYNVPDGADFGIRISGDSMTPRYADGQIVWVHHQDTLEEGQIGIFELNNECFCKKLSYKDGVTQLISLNSEKYSPIIVQESDSFRIFGHVIN